MKARKVFETIDFKRGIDSKRSLGVGYINVMPDILKDLYDEVNKTSQDIQFQTAILLNHPSDSGAVFSDSENSVYNLQFGLEGGHGLPEDSDDFALEVIYIDPFDLKIYGEISGEKEMEEFNQNIGPASIPNNEISTMARATIEMGWDLLEKAEIEIE